MSKKGYIVTCLFSFLITSCNPNRNITRHYVETMSMKPTINPGDYVLVDSTLRTFDYGDILCYYFEGNKDLEPYMNAYRVVGLPGDSIETRDDIFCIVNQKENKTRYIGRGVLHRELEEELPNGMKILIYYYPTDEEVTVRQPVKVPNDCYFLMGDSRNISVDSRIFGPVHKDKILGKVTKVIKGHE